GPRVAPSERVRRGEPPRSIGCHVSNVVRVTVRKLPDAGPILDAAVAAGANVVRGIQFTLMDTAKASAEARASAVGDAMMKARQFAAAAGVTAGEILAIRELGVTQPIPLPRAAVQMQAADPIEPGQLEGTGTGGLHQAHR